MILCLDIGNTHIFGGIYVDHELELQFRYSSLYPSTSDQFGVFFKAVLRENDLNPRDIDQVAICSVVPSLNYSIRSSFLKYFSLDPFFLRVEDAGELRIAYQNPQEVGADRICNAIAAINKFPNQNIIVIDFGTATTFDAIAAEKAYLGGIIIPGIYISMKALYENTAKLSAVNILKPKSVIGQSTTENIQAGLYYSHLGAAREIIQQMTTSTFQNKPPFVVGTGGFVHLFEEENLFSAVIPDLVLHGLYTALQQRK